ncbi:hypothetical protein AB1N83_012470 [Pleurotus pulmonarius]
MAIRTSPDTTAIPTSLHSSSPSIINFLKFIITLKYGRSQQAGLRRQNECAFVLWRAYLQGTTYRSTGMRYDGSYLARTHTG